MRRSFIILSLLVLLPSVLSCRKHGAEEDSLAPIRFEVTHSPALTRSMITNESELRTACTPTSVDPSGGGKSIGLWAAMTKAGETTNDVFQGVKLQWRAVGEKGHENNPDLDEETPGNELRWNTMVTESGIDKHAEVYWHPGETYYFRAYYPAGVELASNTSATTFIAEYNARVQQDDLMAAYTKKTLNNKAELEEHVQLNLLHMLAAVQFNFQFKNEGGFYNSDKLMSVWLENTDSGSFGDYALLVFGDGTEAGATDIDWYIMDSPLPGVKMYHWTNESGVQFYKDASNNVPATAFTPTGMGSSDIGEVFTHSNGYVYMIPQELHSGTQICFTTENSCGNVFRVDLPDRFYDNATPDPNEYTSLDPGWRYTFNIVISRLDVEAFITIREWNKLDSSYAIDF